MRALSMSVTPLLGVDPNIISRNPDIKGGVPVFSGTRVPVRMLQQHLMQGGTLESFRQNHPTVYKEQTDQVVGVLFDKTLGREDHE